MCQWVEGRTPPVQVVIDEITTCARGVFETSVIATYARARNGSDLNCVPLVGLARSFEALLLFEAYPNS